MRFALPLPTQILALHITDDDLYWRGPNDATLGHMRATVTQTEKGDFIGWGENPDSVEPDTHCIPFVENGRILSAPHFTQALAHITHQQVMRSIPVATASHTLRICHAYAQDPIYRSLIEQCTTQNGFDHLTYSTPNHYAQQFLHLPQNSAVSSLLFMNHAQSTLYSYDSRRGTSIGFIYSAIPTALNMFIFDKYKAMYTTCAIDQTLASFFTTIQSHTNTTKKKIVYSLHCDEAPVLVITHAEIATALHPILQLARQHILFAMQSLKNSPRFGEGTTVAWYAHEAPVWLSAYMGTLSELEIHLQELTTDPFIDMMLMESPSAKEKVAESETRQ